MLVQPVRTEADHDRALARISELMGAELGTEASDELDVLVTLVDAYEAKHFPINAPDPVTVIKFRMEQQGLSRKDLEPMIGSRARVSEVLTGKRALTLPMIRRLHRGLSIPVDLLVGLSAASPGASRDVKRKYQAREPRIGRRVAAQQSVR